jgi:hypothetical protein
MIVRYPDARRFMDFNALVFGAIVTPNHPVHETAQVIEQYLQSMPEG